MFTHHWFFTLKLFSALGCGLIAGVFFAFSTFVMAALAQRPSAEGIAAMQAINITVINPWFMTAFLGTGAVCLFLAFTSLLKWHQPGAVYLLVGSLLHLLMFHSTMHWQSSNTIALKVQIYGQTT